MVQDMSVQVCSAYMYICLLHHLSEVNNGKHGCLLLRISASSQAYDYMANEY